MFKRTLTKVVNFKNTIRNNSTNNSITNDLQHKSSTTQFLLKTYFLITFTTGVFLFGISDADHYITYNFFNKKISLNNTYYLLMPLLLPFKFIEKMSDIQVKNIEDAKNATDIKEVKDVKK